MASAEPSLVEDDVRWAAEAWITNWYEANDIPERRRGGSCSETLGRSQLHLWHYFRKDLGFFSVLIQFT